MKILAALRQVPDPAHPVRALKNGLGADLDGVKQVMNPFDEIALEAALRLREEGVAQEVVVVAVGPDPWAETLLTGLAMGADRAIHGVTASDLDPLSVARCLAAIAGREEAQLFLFGKQSTDGDHGQVPPMTAGLLGWSQAMAAFRLESSAGGFLVTCEDDHGLLRLFLPIPGVISADLRLNEPRPVRLSGIVKARKKPFSRIDVASLGVDLSPRVQVVGVGEPPPRKGGRRVDGAQAFLTALGLVEGGR